MPPGSRVRRRCWECIVPARGNSRAGAGWRFDSEANREAFRRSPEVFAPAYGGYDAEGIARGTATMPDPTVFKVIDGRLFLFRSEEAMQRFLDESGPAAADAAWPKVAAGLRP